eukprot:3377509-Amphidinium_carterae.1
MCDLAPPIVHLLQTKPRLEKWLAITCPTARLYGLFGKRAPQRSMRCCYDSSCSASVGPHCAKGCQVRQACPIALIRCLKQSAATNPYIQDEDLLSMSSLTQCYKLSIKKH